ncbi:MAG TPA: class I SAM-dependent methyltransferase [Psychromonas sp.]
MNEHDKGQVAASAAEIYEQFFIPALFIDWPAQVLELAGVHPGDSVLDVACGTGVLAREALDLVGSEGRVVGLDINDGMLAVARLKSSKVNWLEGAAESLPFDRNEFDHVISQFGLMFFQDRSKAVSEMVRVMKADGIGCVAVWASLAETPGYLAVATMLKDLFGADIAKSIEAPYCLGDVTALESLFAEAGAKSVRVHTRPGKARFDSIDAWLHTDIKGWTLAEVIDAEGYEQLRKAAPDYLSEFAHKGGKVEFDAPAHLVTFSA